MVRKKIKSQKTEANSFGFLFLVITLFTSCKQEQTLTAKQIIERSVEAHGGLKNWNNLSHLSFDKSTTLFNEDGSIESNVDQFQLFQFQPELFGKIEWKSKDDNHLIIYENKKIEKYIDDSLVTNENELQRTKNSFLAAQYVIGQPFELLKSSSKLTYKGIIDLDGRKAYQIGVKYQGDTQTSNKWTYFIDTKTFEVIANKVALTDHTSWIENLTFDTTTPFKFNADRKSYRLNESGEKTYLRAVYYYSNFSVHSQD